MKTTKKTRKGPSQLPLGFGLRKEPDRNAKLGGRSFYFFDLDDNVFYLKTPIYIFDRRSGSERAVSTAEFAQIAPSLGKPGPYEHFCAIDDDRIGSFRRFRDLTGVEPGSSQPFVEDIDEVLDQPDFHWKGPSWDCFEYAVHNERPVALITARGHEPETIQRGIYQLVEAGFLSREPNYLQIFPVSHPEVRRKLGNGSLECSTAELKKRAILLCVEAAMKRYGHNSHHRFGMSDDDPRNIELIIDAKRSLKRRYPDNSFFVIHAAARPVLKQEIFADMAEKEAVYSEQLDFEF